MYRLAVGRAGCSPSEYWELTPRELALILKGFAEQKQSEYAVLFNLIKFNAQSLAMSKQQATAIGNTRNPFSEKKEAKAMTMDQIGLKLKPLEAMNGRS